MLTIRPEHGGQRHFFDDAGRRGELEDIAARFNEQFGEVP